MSNKNSIDISGYCGSVELREVGSLDMCERGRELIFNNQINIGRSCFAPQPMLTKEEQLKRVDKFIEKYNLDYDEKIESDLADSNYIYLYKKTDLDGKDSDTNGDFIYKVGKTFATELNTGLGDNLMGNLVYPSIHEVIELSKSFSQYQYMVSTISTPDDPSQVYKNTYKIFKVKVAKSDIVITTNNEIRVSQVEIIEDVKLIPKLSYNIINITEIKDGFKFSFEIKNDITGASLRVDVFNDVIDVPQVEMKDMIKDRMIVMQDIFDEFSESNGVL